jgi:hypothetical protein
MPKLFSAPIHGTRASSSLSSPAGERRILSAMRVYNPFGSLQRHVTRTLADTFLSTSRFISQLRDKFSCCNMYPVPGKLDHFALASGGDAAGLDFA